MSQMNPPPPPYTDPPPESESRREFRSFKAIAFIVLVIIATGYFLIFGFPKNCAQHKFLYRMNDIGIVSCNVGTSTSGYQAIMGTAENITGKDLSSVTIVFLLYDAAGTALDTASGTIKDFKYAQSQSFECVMKVQNIRSYKLNEIIIS